MKAEAVHVRAQRLELTKPGGEIPVR